MMGGADDSETVYNNVFRYVYNCVRGGHTYVYNNLCEFIVIEGWPNADHANGISIFGPWSGTSVWAYNNVVRNTTSSAVGSETFWVMSNGGCSGCTSFIFNNVLYNNGRGIDTGDHPTVGSDGNFYMWNNTVEGGGNHCYGNGETGNSRPVYAGNNHCINVGSVCDPNGTVCNALGSSVDLSQTTAQADVNTSPHFDQYTASETYAYSPVAATNSTAGAGTNFTSFSLPSSGGAIVCSGKLQQVARTRRIPNTIQCITCSSCGVLYRVLQAEHGISGPMNSRICKAKLRNLQRICRPPHSKVYFWLFLNGSASNRSCARARPILYAIMQLTKAVQVQDLTSAT